MERIQKILSARGIASRRKAEEYILQGLVTVNGVVATLGQKADPEHDKIEVAGKVLEDRQTMLYVLLNKPKGVLCTNLPADFEHPTPTVLDVLPKRLRGKVFPVGRLDKETAGLLLLTNDGVLAYRLTHPKFDHEKEYLVYTENIVTLDHIQQLRGFMRILGETLKPVKVVKQTDHSFTITLTEGKNRQIRRMCSNVGLGIKKLIRIRIMNITDAVLEPGAIRDLTSDEKSKLFTLLGLTR